MDMHFYFLVEVLLLLIIFLLGCVAGGGACATYNISTEAERGTGYWKEETVAGTSLRFSSDVVGSSTQHAAAAAAAAPRLKNKNEHVFCCNLYVFLQHASRFNSSAVNNHNRSIAV